MTLNLYLFLLFFCSIGLISSQTDNNASRTDFVTIAKAILQNKNTLSDNPSYSSTFGYWQGAGFNTDNYFSSTMTEGLIIQNWSTSVDSWDWWSFTLQIFNGNYTDQNGVIIRVETSSDQMNINRYNATITLYNLQVTIEDIFGSYGNYYTGDLDIYFVDKVTNQVPDTFDTYNLKSYTTQFRFVSSRSSIQFSTTLFDDSYQVSEEDKIFFLIGTFAYFCISLCSIFIHKPNRRKASDPSLRLLIFFPMYVIGHFVSWYLKVKLASDLIFYLIPLAVVIFIDFIKHIVEVYKNDGDNGWCFLLVYPVPITLLMVSPPEGLFIGYLISCLFLIPQVTMKWKERHDRQKHLTRFEVGNWLCMSLLMMYLNLYPNNVFLSSPKPLLILIHSGVILIQLLVLIYLQFAVPRKNAFKYTFAAQDQNDQEKLLSDQCAICIGSFITESREKLYKTPCGHLFHSDCLKSWGGKKLECPVCRAQIPNFVQPVE